MSSEKFEEKRISVVEEHEGPQAISDESRLESLGYKQDLKREMSMVSVLGLAFCSLNPPLSIYPLLGTILTAGGPQGALIAYPCVSILSAMVGLVMSEIQSAYPTSGGLYFWSAQLAGETWAPLASYFTGYLNLIGMVGINSSVVFTIGQLITALPYVNGSLSADRESMEYKGITVACSLLMLAFTTLINTLPGKVLHKIGVAFAFVNVVVWIIVLVVPVAATAQKGLPIIPQSELWATFVNQVSLPDAWTAVISILPACYVMIGYDSAAHMSEETHNAALAGPAAIMGSIVWAGAFGWALLAAVLAIIPFNAYATLGSITTSYAVDLFLNNIGPGGAYGVTILLIVLGFGVIFALQATQARQCYAFARDGALPGSAVIRRLSKHHKVPINALLVVAACNAIIILPALGSSVALNAIVSIGTVGGYLTYLIPITLRIVRPCIVLLLPSVGPTLPPSNSSADLSAYFMSFNFAPIMIVLFLLINITAWYWVRKWFKGPRIMQNGAVAPDPEPVE
ncbi:hypothetical protein Unana1_08862 [Umbelopsis nana]